VPISTVLILRHTLSTRGTTSVRRAFSDTPPSTHIHPLLPLSNWTTYKLTLDWFPVSSATLTCLRDAWR